MYWHGAKAYKSRPGNLPGLFPFCATLSGRDFAGWRIGQMLGPKVDTTLPRALRGARAKTGISMTIQVPPPEPDHAAEAMVWVKILRPTANLG